MIDAQTAEAEAEQLERAIAEVAEQKRRRKAEIEFGLPILDAEVERTQMRLEEMKKEMYRLEAEVQKGLEGRKVSSRSSRVWESTPKGCRSRSPGKEGRDHETAAHGRQEAR
jgi:multidrug resistance efflux pump